ncbi:MAG: hypothetical protein HY077_07495 [Elusimicrobia bacterium]|nr:hypothetical protein [Elusimicrobiota bacterium]
MKTRVKARAGRKRNGGLGDGVLHFVRTVYRRALKTLPLYASRYSKKKFSQPQMAACLLLKDYLQLDLRSLEALLSSEPALRETLELTEPPDHSTLCRHASRRVDDFILQPVGTGTVSFIVGPNPGGSDELLPQT